MSKFLRYILENKLLILHTFIFITKIKTNWRGTFFVALYHKNVSILNLFLWVAGYNDCIKKGSSSLKRLWYPAVFYGLLLSAKKMSSRKKSFRVDIKNDLKKLHFYSEFRQYVHKVYTCRISIRWDIVIGIKMIQGVRFISIMNKFCFYVIYLRNRFRSLIIWPFYFPLFYVNKNLKRLSRFLSA